MFGLFIQLLHIIYILFVFIVPFTNSNQLLVLHVMMMPLMLMHWYVNNNVCSLTELEMSINGNRDSTKCYTCKIVYPIYDFTRNYHSFVILSYVVVIILWLISVWKLYHKYQTGEITSIMDLLKK